MFTKLLESCRGVSLISALAALLFTVSTDSFAMNQEGHDDWMTDLPQAIALLAAIPKRGPCRVETAPSLLKCWRTIPVNIYRCRDTAARENNCQYVHRPIRRPPDDCNRIEGCL